MSQEVEAKARSFVIDDGFDVDDEDQSTIIKGKRVKFTNDAQWVTSGGEVLAPGREFVVLGTIRVLQKWIVDPATGRVVPDKEETRILARREYVDVKAMNDAAPRSEWRKAFGQDKPPWEKASVAYLLDQKTLERFTFPTATDGGRRAISELCGDVQTARKVKGPNVYPIVTLGDVFFETQYGGRQRPHFVIRGYAPLGPQSQAAAPQVEHAVNEKRDSKPVGDSKPGAGDAKPSKPKPAFDDEIPF